MKNKNNTTRPTEFRRPRNTATCPQREAHRFTPMAPHHDLLVLSFYPGMGRSAVRAGQATAA
ncbi:MAG: hypothetical protein ABI273_14660 [Lacunisphaera sp.]